MIATYIVSVDLPQGTATKIGSTRNWKQRRRAIERDLRLPLRDVLVMPAESYDTALRRERMLQAAFEDCNLNAGTIRPKRGDWFKIPFANH